MNAALFAVVILCQMAIIRTGNPRHFAVLIQFAAVALLAFSPQNRIQSERRERFDRIAQQVDGILNAQYASTEQSDTKSHRGPK